MLHSSMAAMNSQSRLSSSFSSSSSSSSSHIPLHKTQFLPRMYPFSLSPPPNPPKSHHHKHLLLIICLSFFPFLLYLLSLYRSLHLPSSSSFGLVIHISDSHSQILVFRSLNEVSGTPFSGQTSHSMSAQTGLSGPGSDVLGRVVIKLLKFAEDKVPSSEWKGTKVQLVITAEEEDGVEGVLEECRRVLRSSGFLFRDDWASVLRGQDEGLYSWLAVNYALGYIGNKPHDTAGVIVLGKSAMQVSFASTEPPVSNVTSAIRLAGVSYQLYTWSMQQFGQDVIWKLLHEQGSQDLRSFTENNERTVSNPCIPRGFELTPHASDGELVKSHGAGNFSACKSALMNLLNGRQGKCLHPPCEITMSILNELERKPHPQQRFFLTSELEGLVPKASVSSLEAVGQHFCDDHWETLREQYHIDSRDLSKSCFSHAFAAAVLQNSFGIPFDDKRVEFAAGSTQIDWRLGAFLFQSIVEPLDGKAENLDTQIVRNKSFTYLLLFAVALMFILLAAFFLMKLRKPQYKTIYDLENGRYIVTRVPR